MKSWLIFIAVPLLLGTGCSAERDRRACTPVDPVQVELGGIRYSIPASYQPRFSHKLDQEKNFYVFWQDNYNYNEGKYKDGTRKRYRYCKQEGTHTVEGMSFDLEFGNNRKNDGYDVRDFIITANSPRFDVLDNVTSMRIDNVPASIDQNSNHYLYKDAVLSENGLFYYKNGQNHKDGNCDQAISSVHPSIFGGKIEASCITSIVKPHTISWHLSIAADKLGKPNGRLGVRLHSKVFEEWPPILDGVKAFIESMQDDNH